MIADLHCISISHRPDAEGCEEIESRHVSLVQTGPSERRVSLDYFTWRQRYGAPLQQRNSGAVSFDSAKWFHAKLGDSTLKLTVSLGILVR